MHDVYAFEKGLTKIHPNTQLFTSDELQEGYFGRIFKIKTECKANAKEVTKHIKTKRAHIICKNYPLTVAELRKKLKLSDGGEDYILAFTDYLDKKRMIACTRLK